MSPELLGTVDEWFSVRSLRNLAFDHQAIIKKAIQHLSDRNDISLARYLLPRYFPLNALQKTATALLGKEYDNRNFRRMVMDADIVKETSRMTEKVSHRPAKLYEFNKR